MDTAWQFVKDWYTAASDMMRTGDPLLMGAAIAYNSLFALFPLAIAFFAIVTFFDASSRIYVNVIKAIDTVLPDEIASFFIDIVGDSVDALSSERLAIVGVSVLVALWSGSRAVYAVQKSLRLVQGVEEHRGYVQARLTGVVVTTAGASSLIAAYLVLLNSGGAWDAFTDFIHFPSIGLTQALVGLVGLWWVGLLLWAMYRFGPPQPLDHAVTSAVVVTAICVGGTLLSQLVLPSVDVASVAVFGAVGLVLVWLYFIGIVVIAVPVGVIGFYAALEAHRQR
jgi:uncharacterized BrkB/YihY/UPF0761 family membrane protein